MHIAYVLLKIQQGDLEFMVSLPFGFTCSDGSGSGQRYDTKCKTRWGSHFLWKPLDRALRSKIYLAPESEHLALQMQAQPLILSPTASWKQLTSEILQEIHFHLGIIVWIPGWIMNSHNWVSLPLLMRNIILKKEFLCNRVQFQANKYSHYKSFSNCTSSH